MAKAKKPKVEQPVVEAIETTVGDIEVLSSESVVPEPEIGDEPPSVTLEEVKEVEKVPEPVIVAEAVVENVVYPISKPADDLPMEQKIENFLEGKDGFVRANDFLKSLFGIPKFNEPAQWLQQGNSKLLKATLEKMVANNDIVVKDNRHRLLGQPYYPDTTTGKQQHRNLNNVEILIKK